LQRVANFLIWGHDMTTQPRVLRPWLVGCLALLAGCATPEEAPVIAQPKTLPVRNLTSFSESLRCMDNLFAQFGVRDVAITSAGLPDATGEISAGTKDMLISAISRMSVKSNAFRFVDFDQNEFDVNALQGLIGFTDDFIVPNYYIRGAITQLDEGVVADNVGASVAGPEFTAGFSADSVVSVVSMDLNLGDLVTRQIMPGMSAHNSISVTRTGRAGDAGGQIESYGLFFNLSLNRAEGMHAAVRSLIELSTIETLGKLAKVPYWRCLAIEQTNPAVVAQARGWFADMSAREQVVFVQRALASRGYYEAPVTAELDGSTRGAIARYQEEKGLIADGRISFDLYASLINQDLSLGREPDPLQVNGGAPIRPNPLTLTLATPGGTSPTYRLNQPLEMTVIASQDAYLYCYYQDAKGGIARIFPNQFQPDPYVQAGRAVDIPGQDAGFDIVFDQVGAREEVACLASPRELGLNLPAELKTADLRPMPVESLDDLIEAFRRLDRVTLIEARLPIRVTG
jgi:peptidoglycan hydrolase-like protein with peptidoglycan-binding domain/curli biogenesis system outer membrane secretion channel CsgG